MDQLDEMEISSIDENGDRDSDLLRQTEPRLDLDLGVSELQSHILSTSMRETGDGRRTL